MLISQLSNLFNQIAAAIGFEFYHYGWPADVNRNLPNNYDPNSETGRKFPYLLLLPPTQSMNIDPAANRNQLRTYAVECLILDTYGYNAQDFSYKNETVIKMESKLQRLSERLMRALFNYSEYAQPGFTIGDTRTDFDPYLFAGNVRCIRMSFSLSFIAPCLDYDFDPETEGLPLNPADLDTYDEEDISDATQIP